MNESRYEYKVGLFVVIGISLLALLILNFSKGVTLGSTTYKLRLLLPNAAGLKPTADVMMAGVPIGKVTSLTLAENTRSVEVSLAILSKYKIRQDAAFRIDSLGFLGDQYVAVTVPEAEPASTNDNTFLRNGDTVHGEPTFNMLEAVQSVSGVIDQTRKTVRDLDQAITNVNASALSKQTLLHFAAAVSNLEVITLRASGAANRAEDLLRQNARPFGAAVSNFETMSGTLTNSAAQLDQILANNRGNLGLVLTNLVTASDQIKDITLDLRAGKGAIGGLLTDPTAKIELESTLSNANVLAAELTEFGHNLNERGLWSMLWKPKHKKEKDPTPAYSNTP
jgi:phospholipid/cholesterol/gamma-HCH transport system substrate-binding protein